MATPLRILVVEDEPASRERFAGFVRATPGFELLAAVPDGASALALLARAEPDVVLVDLGLPDMSGTVVIREALRRHPGTDVMVVTVFGDEAHVVASIEAGATGYLLKDSLPQEFGEAVRQLRAGASPISPMIARQLLRRLRGTAPDAVPEPGRPRLSGRETEILSQAAKGFSFGEIARALDISPHTVTAHVKKIYEKLAVHSRGEAVYEAGRLGLLR